jgi:hypothetical protein
MNRVRVRVSVEFANFHQLIMVIMRNKVLMVIKMTWFR